MITGEITLYQPAAIPAGQPLNIFISFDAYNEGGKFWNTRITAQTDGRSDTDLQYHPLEKGRREAEKLMLGTMPNSTIHGTILLEGRGYTWMGGLLTGWDTLDYKSFTVSPAVTEAVIAPKLPDPYKPIISLPDFTVPDFTTPTFEEPFETKTPEEKKQIWLWVGLATVGVIGIVLFLR